MSVSEGDVQEFYFALQQAHLVKVQNALNRGFPVHPVLPVNVRTKPYDTQEKLSPLTYLSAWPWETKFDRCLTTLNALLAAGADPNLPNGREQRPLHTLLWLPRPSVPLVVVERLLEAGANPYLMTATTANRWANNALLCGLTHGAPVSHVLALLRRAPQLTYPPACRAEASALQVLVSYAHFYKPEERDEIAKAMLAAGADPALGNEGERQRQNSLLGHIIEPWLADQMKTMLASEIPSPISSVPARARRL